MSQTAKPTTLQRVKVLIAMGLCPTIAEIARRGNLSRPAVYDVLTGRTKNPKTQQAVTNAARLKLFRGVHVTQSAFSFQPGDEMEMPSDASAEAAENEFAGYVRRAGRGLTFVKRTPIIITHLLSGRTAMEPAPAATQRTERVRSKQRPKPPFLKGTP